MDIGRSTVVPFTALLASLLFLLMPDTNRREGDLPSPAPDMQVNLTPALQREIQQKLVEASADARPPSATNEKPEVGLPDFNLLSLYPELEQIIQLENSPPEMALDQLRILLYDADPVIRLAALESIADMNHYARLPVLTAALDDPFPQIRIAALEALGIESIPAAVTSIEPYLFDREHEVRLAAIEALANLEDERAVQSLAGLLSDQDVEIRRYAVNAMGDIGGESAISYLRQARYDPDEDIRENASAILVELEGAAK